MNDRIDVPAWALGLHAISPQGVLLTPNSAIAYDGVNVVVVNQPDSLGPIARVHVGGDACKAALTVLPKKSTAFIEGETLISGIARFPGAALDIGRELPERLQKLEDYTDGAPIEVVGMPANCELLGAIDKYVRKHWGYGTSQLSCYQLQSGRHVLVLRRSLPDDGDLIAWMPVTNVQMSLNLDDLEPGASEAAPAQQ